MPILFSSQNQVFSFFRKSVAGTLFFLTALQLFAQDPFANVDVTHYRIVLDMTNKSGKYVEGFTEITFKLNAASDSVMFYLEGLTVTQISENGNALSYAHNGKELQIGFGSKKAAGAEITCRIDYNGKPIKDASWGGFYYSGDYAYNLGVAFTSDPHNYGRVWFPCADNFTDHATYEFEITTLPDDRAMCNGELISSEKNVDGNTVWKWKMETPITTYLASVAVAPYTVNHFEHKNIPVDLCAVAQDSLNMAKSFVHLPDAIDGFLEHYGNYNFNRVGYCVVPFNGGAMEHATNIAYPLFAVDGSLDEETLYAHELSHHWWGDAVTCKTASDMWINEGWAAFSESLFMEYVYGKERYKEYAADNHFNVLHYAHLFDGDTLPVAGVDHKHTYGQHVYYKGADMIHTLRGVMGDSSFFLAASTFVQSNVGKNVTTDDVQNHFQAYTSLNLTEFFNAFIRQPGFVAFDFIEWNVNADGNQFKNNVRIRRRLRFAPNPFNGVPLEITAVSDKFEKFTTTVLINEDDAWFSVNTPFKPVCWLIDLEEKISDAMTDKAITISDTGNYDFGTARMKVHVGKIKDSAFVRIEHYWVGADAYFNAKGNPVLSRERYWNVTGVWPESFEASAVIEYNGRNSGSAYKDGYFDIDLIRIREDSLVLMYRPNAAADWEIDMFNTFEINSPFDKRGTIYINKLRKGEYVLAIRDQSILGIKEITKSDSYLKIYPNPSSGEVNFECTKAANATLEITNSSGQKMYSAVVKNNNDTVQVSTTGWAPGFYYAGLVINGRMYEPKLFVIKN
ncbi:MAG: T9SS type A sorting domain-containing protein [Bacteroidetes bacterium]|nr:T9SS type A sorting domain-containing protein [Bacteroidota bacterium]